uniref:Anticodon_1 domain-containing protein n=1 Tax=Elaeophora elaphi TaxID=1147741 RepID=A0A0R3RJL2_9BILA
LTSFDEIPRINEVNLIALETFGKLNQFWGNVNRLFMPLAEHIERGLVSLLHIIFPELFGDLKPSDTAMNKVTRSPDKSNMLVEELIAALLGPA